MTLVSMVLTDAFFYRDAGFLWFSPIHIPSGRWFEWFSQMHFPIMTLVYIVLTDAFSYRDACFSGSHRCIFLS